MIRMPSTRSLCVLLGLLLLQGTVRGNASAEEPTRLEPFISQKTLLFLSPHQDDIALTFGGLISNHHGFPGHNNRYKVFFSVSEYTENNLDLKTNKRVRTVTLMRTSEDFDALLEMFGSWDHVRYASHGLLDAPLRNYEGPKTAGGGPGGDFSTFRDVEKEIYTELSAELGLSLRQEDCAAFVLMANGQHIDHFILREAVIKAAHDLGEAARCQIYFGEDQPYTGSAAHECEVKQELAGLEKRLRLPPMTYPIDIEKKVRFFEDNYISQYEDSYISALRDRVQLIGGERVYKWDRASYSEAKTDPTCKETYCQLD